MQLPFIGSRIGSGIGSRIASRIWIRVLDSRLNMTSVPFAAAIADHILRRKIAK
jgi:hypothetical protein